MSVRQASAGILLFGGLLVGCGSPQPSGTAGQFGSLSATCVPGYTDMFAPDGIQYGSDNAGSQPDGPFYGGTPASEDSLEPAPAIEVTVRNSGTSYLTVTALDVVMFAGSSEAGSATLNITPSQTIAGAQSLSFAAVGVSYDGQWTSDADNLLQANIPTGVTRCTVSQISQ